MMDSGPARAAASRRAGHPQRVHHSHVEWVTERLSDRDWAIIETTNRLRLVSGSQLERLHFHSLAGHARTVVRGRVLLRLVQWRVLAVLPRRVGGAARGSAGSVYALGTTGARACAERHAATTTTLPRVRHPGPPTERTVRHTLAVSELYVRLVELARTHGASVVSFEAEPASWWPNGLGGYLKPDAHATLARGRVREHWWVEVDLATESVPTVKRKLGAYLDFMERGQLGPGDVMPRVLVTTASPVRHAALQSVVTRLPDPAPALFLVVAEREAAATMLQSLQE